MTKEKVYYFKVYDVTTDEMLTSKRPAIREAIIRCSGTPIEETEHEVDAALLDENGFVAKR